MPESETAAAVKYGVKNMETIKTDIIVAGAGAAGMMAALTAADAGLKCCVIEKGKNISASNGAKAGGPALANTRLQKECGEIITEEQLYQHMYRFSRGTVNAGLLRRAVAKGAKVEELFLRNGVKMTLLEDTYGVGFRARQMFTEVGKKRWQPLADDLIAKGGEIHFQRAAEKLIVQDGNVKGVIAADVERPEELYFYSAKAVILATGGYLGNEDMIHEHFGNINVIPLGSRLSNGAGIKMALQAGGILDRNWGICSNEFGGCSSKVHKGKGLFSTNLAFAICAGLLVNKEGRRFMNEQYLSDQPLSIGGEIVLREGIYYCVMDQDMYESLAKMTPFEYFGSPSEWHAGKTTHNTMLRRNDTDLEEDREDGWVFCEETLEDLEAKTGLRNLAQTVKDYNEVCRQGADTEFGKAPYLLKPLQKAPFYLFEYEPGAWCTFGGVKTDEYCRLLTKDNKAIQGVYVAGVDNGSGYMSPYYDNEGAALGMALTMGVAAGEHAAEYIRGSQHLQ